jgi:hypothetical protein
MRGPNQTLRLKPQPVSAARHQHCQSSKPHTAVIHYAESSTCHGLDVLQGIEEAVRTMARQQAAALADISACIGARGNSLQGLSGHPLSTLIAPQLPAVTAQLPSLFGYVPVQGVETHYAAHQHPQQHLYSSKHNHQTSLAQQQQRKAQALPHVGGRRSDDSSKGDVDLGHQGDVSEEEVHHHSYTNKLPSLQSQGIRPAARQPPGRRAQAQQAARR